MPEVVQKIDVTCPHCGAVQKEPRSAVSTYCRSCSSHFDLNARSAVLRTRPKGPVRPVHCYKCGTDHEVSKHARSTLCPSCGAGIELSDLDFSANGSRPVDIRGRLRIRSNAHLNNSWIICTDARIEGRITGTILCENQLELLGSGKLSFRATASSTIIGPKATIDMGFPLKTGSLEIHGSLSGQVFCSGTVHVRKHGLLQGSLEARGLVVDRGGRCEAQIKITSSHTPPSELKVWKA